MKRRYKIIIVLIVILIVTAVVGFTIFSFLPKDENKVEILESIDEYGYNLENRDKEYYVNNFNILKDILSSDEIDYEKYAEQISILFITDLYSINNKINKYDVGGIDFVYESYKESFKNKISDTMYKYMALEDVHNLPEIKSVEIEEIIESTFNFNETDYESYEVSISWKFAEELGYETSSKITIIKEEEKLFIVELSNGDANE